MEVHKIRRFLRFVIGCFYKIRIDRTYFLCIMYIVGVWFITGNSISIIISQTGGVEEWLARPKPCVCNHNVVCAMDL